MTIAGITCELLQIEDSLNALRYVLLGCDDENKANAVLVGADAVVGIRERVKKSIEELDKMSGD